MKCYIKYILGFLVCCTTLYSCVEEQDFGQLDDLRVTPEAEASILYIESPESLINAAGDADVISRNFNFDAFSSDIFAERVLDGTVTYVVENTTSKDISISIELLDVEGNLLDTEVINVPPAPTPELTREVFYGNAENSIDIIRNTSSIRVTAVNNGNSTSTSDLPDPKIILKSSGKFRLEIK